MSHLLDVFQLQDLRDFAYAMRATEQVILELEIAGQLISVLSPDREPVRLFPRFQLSQKLNAALHQKAIAIYRARGLDMTIYWDFLRTRHAAFGGAAGVEVLLYCIERAALQELPVADLEEVFLEAAEEDMHRAVS